MCFCGGGGSFWRGGSGRPSGCGGSSGEGVGFEEAGVECGAPTGTMREPNSTPMVTSWCWTKRPSQRRIVREDLPQPESPMQTNLAM